MQLICIAWTLRFARQPDLCHEVAGHDL